LVMKTLDRIESGSVSGFTWNAAESVSGLKWIRIHSSASSNLNDCGCIHIPDQHWLYRPSYLGFTVKANWPDSHKERVAEELRPMLRLGPPLAVVHLILWGRGYVTIFLQRLSAQLGQGKTCTSGKVWLRILKEIIIQCGNVCRDRDVFG
jgi:hypothetical protein